MGKSDKRGGKREYLRENESAKVYKLEWNRRKT